MPFPTSGQSVGDLIAELNQGGRGPRPGLYPQIAAPKFRPSLAPNPELNEPIPRELLSPPAQQAQLPIGAKVPDELLPMSPAPRPGPPATPLDTPSPSAPVAKGRNPMDALLASVGPPSSVGALKSGFSGSSGNSWPEADRAQRQALLDSGWRPNWSAPGGMAINSTLYGSDFFNQQSPLAGVAPNTPQWTALKLEQMRGQSDQEVEKLRQGNDRSKFVDTLAIQPDLTPEQKLEMLRTRDQLRDLDKLNRQGAASTSGGNQGEADRRAAAEEAFLRTGQALRSQPNQDAYLEALLAAFPGSTRTVTEKPGLGQSAVGIGGIKPESFSPDRLIDFLNNSESLRTQGLPELANRLSQNLNRSVASEAVGKALIRNLNESGPDLENSIWSGGLRMDGLNINPTVSGYRIAGGPGQILDLPNPWYSAGASNRPGSRQKFSPFFNNVPTLLPNEKEANRRRAESAAALLKALMPQGAR